MQADDNSKYLNRKLSGRESRAGELFLDYRNHFDEVGEDGHLLYENSDNLVIYGHNMKDETMFGSLKYYDWYDTYYGEHPVIDLNSNYEQYKYKIFSIFILDAEDESDTKFDCWNKLDFSSEEEYYEFVNEAKRRTLRVNDVDVKYGDKLLTLSTCNTVLGQRGRLIVLARLVRDGEDPMAGTQNSTRNTNIKWPNLYYDYKGIRNTYDPEAEFVPYGPSEDKKQEVSGDKK
jgi:sortase B